MLATVRTQTAPRSNPAPAAASQLERRRAEIRAMLDDIRAKEPSPSELVDAVRRAGGDAVPRDRLHRIATSILSLFRAR